MASNSLLDDGRRASSASLKWVAASTSSSRSGNWTEPMCLKTASRVLRGSTSSSNGRIGGKCRSLSAPISI